MWTSNNTHQRMLPFPCRPTVIVCSKFAWSNSAAISSKDGFFSRLQLITLYQHTTNFNSSNKFSRSCSVSLNVRSTRDGLEGTHLSCPRGEQGIVSRCQLAIAKAMARVRLLLPAPFSPTRKMLLFPSRDNVCLSPKDKKFSISTRVSILASSGVLFLALFAENIRGHFQRELQTDYSPNSSAHSTSR